MKHTMVARCIGGKRVHYERKVTPKVVATAKKHLIKALKVWEKESPKKRERAGVKGFREMHHHWIKVKVPLSPCPKK